MPDQCRLFYGHYTDAKNDCQFHVFVELWLKFVFSVEAYQKEGMNLKKAGKKGKKRGRKMKRRRVRIPVAGREKPAAGG